MLPADADWRIEPLMVVVDQLWHRLEPAQIVAIRDDDPELYHACHVIHDILRHDGSNNGG